MYPDALPKNTTLSDGKYIIKGVRGQGGFGITYIATFVSLRTTVAIKECFLSKFCKRLGNDVQVIAPQHETIYNKYRTEFLTEAQKIADSKHPNVVPIQDFFTDNNTAYYVMEYVDSVTLQDLVKTRSILTETDTIHYIKQIAEALQVVHRKSIIHRDIKPGNILIKDNSIAILIDFGAARDILNEETEHTVMLTEGFAPPEQYAKDGAKGVFIDVYGLGATMYYCLTGTIPLSAQVRKTTLLKEPRELNSMLSPMVNDIVKKAMDLDPTLRHPSISTLLYELTTALASSPVEHVSLTSSQSDALRNFEEFLLDNKSAAYVLAGPTHSGKTHLVHAFVAHALKENRHARVLTIGSRLAEAIRNKNRIDTISSLYSLLYDFSKLDEASEENGSPSVDKEGKEKLNYNIRPNGDPENEIYIVDEAHLLSDFYMDNDLLLFGTGKLLNDFLSFMDLSNNPKRKVIFIGDRSQLPRGAENESALSLEHLSDTYQVQSKSFELTDIIPYGKTTIVSEALEIHKQIKLGIYNRLHIKADANSVVVLRHDEFQSHYQTLEDQSESICINYSKKQVLATNLSVREALGRKQLLVAGDKILVHNRFYTTENHSEHTVFSGEFGKVIFVNPIAINVTQKLNGGREVKLTFWEVQISFPRLAITTTTRILENFLVTENVKLSKDEQQALFAWSAQEGKNKLKIETDLKTSTPERKEYETIAFVKYGYAITCHKSQGYTWKNVYVDFESEQGKANKAYFMWCYTAITRAEGRVFLISPPTIDPYFACHWTENHNVLDPNFSHQPHFKKLEITPEQEIESLNYHFPQDKPHLKTFWANTCGTLKPHGIVVNQIDHNPYQEQYHFSNSTGQKGKIVFHYNGKGEFTKNVQQPRSSFTERIISLLDQAHSAEITHEMTTPESFEFEFLKELFADLRTKLTGQGIVIYSLTSTKYQEKYILYKENAFAEFSFYYNDEGFITTIYPVKATSPEILLEISELLKLNYIKS